MLRHDDGVALMTVIGVVAVATALALGAFFLASQSITTSERVESESQAFQVANAGIDAALATIQNNGFNDDDYPMNDTLPNGSYEVSITPITFSEYNVTSTGTSNDGAEEQIHVKFWYLNLWEMFFSAGDGPQSVTAGGGGMHGNTSIDGPFYVVGTIEFPANSSIERGPLFVREGQAVQRSSGTIGTAAVPIEVYATYGYDAQNESNVDISRLSYSPPDLTLPALDQDYLDYYFAAAVAESVDNVMGYQGMRDPDISNTEHDGSGDANTYPTAIAGRAYAPGAQANYKVISPAGATDPSALGAGATGLTIGGTGSWGAWEGNGYAIGSGKHDDFAYDDVNDILYVEGNVFVDGPVTFAESIEYVGNGSIVANGDVWISDELRPQHNGYDLSEDEALGVVSATTITFAINADNNPPIDVAGAYFAKDGIIFKKKLYFKGSIVAGHMWFETPNPHLITDPLLPSFLPESMPGAGNSMLISSQWSRQ
jgi:hypothetical protein